MKKNWIFSLSKFVIYLCRSIFISASLLWSISVAGEDIVQHGFKVSMRSEHYQIIKVSNSTDGLRYDWNEENQQKSLDLLQFKKLLDNKNPEVALVVQYINEITNNESKKIYLEGITEHDTKVYFDKYWITKSSPLQIVGYKRLSYESGLNSYLGPFASIPTYSYGWAKYLFHYKGETVSFVGSTLKDVWSIRKMYWTYTEMFVPFKNSSGVDMAVISMSLPIQPFDDVEEEGMFVLIPNGFKKI